MLIPKLLSLFAALSAANPLATLFAPLTRRSKTYTKDPVFAVPPFPGC